MAAKAKSKSKLTTEKREYGMTQSQGSAGVAMASPFLGIAIPGVTDKLLKVSAPEIIKWDKAPVGSVAQAIIKSFGPSPLKEYQSKDETIRATEIITVDCIVANGPESYTVIEKCFPNQAVVRGALVRTFGEDFEEAAAGCLLVIKNQGKRATRSTMNNDPEKQMRYYDFEVALAFPKGHALAKKFPDNVFDPKQIYDNASN